MIISQITKVVCLIASPAEYFQICNRACKAVIIECQKRHIPCKATAYRRYDELDGYVRQRLRVNFANRGKRHAGAKDGKLLNVKYGNSFFRLSMKLVSGAYLAECIRREISIEEFDALQKAKNKSRYRNDARTNRFFKFAYAK